MIIDTIQQFYDYSWRLHNPFFWSKYNPANVNITKHLQAKDIHGKHWELLDNGNRYDNKVYQNSHSRYDLVLETFLMENEIEHFRRLMGHPAQVSNYCNVIFCLCELEPNFNPETIETIILSRDKRKRRSEHYIGFAIELSNIQIGIRCEMRSRDKMFHWLNKKNPMNNDDYDECCQKQTQIIPLNNKAKDDAIQELNDAIMNELTILDLGGHTIEMLNVISRAQK